MNKEIPETLAAAQSRVSDLEQQLRLSDEGVSRLAQRCLELEQQMLTYQAALAKHSSESEPSALNLPQLFYDSGAGYSQRECLTVTEDAYDELTHEVSAVFTLPTDARALRLDPGALACCIPPCKRHPPAGRLPAVSGSGPEPERGQLGAICRRDEICRELSVLSAGPLPA